MIIDNPKKDIAHFVACRTGSHFSRGYSALAYVRDNEIRCAAIFDIWRGTDIEISVAGIEFPKSFLAACGQYVFDGLKCKRATLRTRTDHQSAISAALRIGAKVEGIQRGFYDGADAILLGIMRGDFRFDNR